MCDFFAGQTRKALTQCQERVAELEEGGAITEASLVACRKSYESLRQTTTQQLKTKEEQIVQCGEEKRFALEQLSQAIDRIGPLETEVSRLNEALGEKDAALAALEEQLSHVRFDISGWSEPMIVTSDDVQATVQANIPKFHNGVFRWPLDARYRLATDEELVEYILWNDLNRWKYVTEFFDCDDFAWVFRGDFLKDTYIPGKGSYGNCLWVIDWSGGHSYCLFLRRHGKLWLYEIQTDTWWDSDQNKWGEGIYALETAGIIGTKVQAWTPR